MRAYSLVDYSKRLRARRLKKRLFALIKSNAIFKKIYRQVIVMS